MKDFIYLLFELLVRVLILYIWIKIFFEIFEVTYYDAECIGCFIDNSNNIYVEINGNSVLQESHPEYYLEFWLPTFEIFRMKVNLKTYNKYRLSNKVKLKKTVGKILCYVSSKKMEIVEG